MLNRFGFLRVYGEKGSTYKKIMIRSSVAGSKKTPLCYSKVNRIAGMIYILSHSPVCLSSIFFSVSFSPDHQWSSPYHVFEVFIKQVVFLAPQYECRV